MTQSIAGALDNLYTSMVALFAGSTGTDGAPVLVTFGPPGQNQPSAIVAIMHTVVQQVDRPTMGPGRSREMHPDVEVIISVYTPGDETQQQVSTDSAFALLATLETNVRTAPNETLGGAAYDAWVSAVPSIEFQVATDPETGSPAGRVTQITATLTAKVRY